MSQSLYELWTAAAGNTPLEWVAVLTGFACVWLAARESLWNFPVAIFSCALYIVIYNGAKLYSDRNLQVLFILLSVYGWYEWLYGGRSNTELHVTRTSRLEWILCGLFVPFFTVGFGTYLTRYTDAVVLPANGSAAAVQLAHFMPYIDSFTTAGSLVAQFLMMRKRLENWWLWILVDIIYVPVLWYKQLFPTSGLYALYLGLAVYGFWEWRRALRKAESTSLISA
ncbi:nicotinamide riboside transporter PnuC [Hymenobacter fodinae]|uniref:nicotinamide riboside transporter PnuC n=1 Tax=Hymenobacter fodinae TaxID=2510796 RepID=UPI0014369129|nr:nicotinamide riboside transporter PnuC [Hymenobacter fodinae]